jgi:hypothetical protein
MPADEYQGHLFERPPGAPTHFFYLATDMSIVKPGQSERPEKRSSRDLHMILIGKVACDCELQGKYAKCRYERLWEQTHRRDRLRVAGQGELLERYRATSAVIAALRFMFSRDDRAMAVIAQLERNQRQATG